MCPACGGAIVAEKDGNSRVVATFPAAVAEWDVGHLPPTVSRIWDEAITVYRVGANHSAVVACGRALEAAADERSLTGGTLQSRIVKMQSQGLITTEFKAAMNYVRLIRNAGAHAGQEVSRESAEGTMRFTQQALRLLFEVPGELARLTAPSTEELGPDQDGDGT